MAQSDLRPGQVLLFVSVLGLFLNGFVVWQHTLSCHQGVVDLKRCLGEWFASAGINMNARIQGF